MPMQLTGNPVNTGTYNQEIAYSNGHVFVANGASGIKAYTFNGTNFTLAGSRDDGGTYLSVHIVGGYIFCGGVDFLRVYTFNGTAFNLVVGNGTRTYKCRARREGANTYVYTARYLGGISVYEFTGAALNIIDTVDAFPGPGADVLFIDSQYIYGGSETGGVRAYDFDGVNLNYITNYVPADSADIQDIDGSGAANIFCSTFGNRIHRLSFNGAAFTQRSVYDLTPYGADHIYLYDNMLYAQIAVLATHAQTWAYAFTTDIDDDIQLFDSIDIPTVAGFTSEDMHFGGGYGYCAKSFLIYAFSMYQKQLIADFIWDPNSAKAPVNTQFTDLSSLRYV
jgi:hypothetical protein